MINLQEIRAAAGPRPPTEVRWSDGARVTRDYPALQPWMLETVEEATRRAVQERILQEWVMACVLVEARLARRLTPHAGMGNVVPAEGETTNPTGNGVRPPSASES